LFFLLKKGQGKNIHSRLFFFGRKILKFEKEEEEEKVCKKDERWTIIMRRSREMNEGL
jgi:hypothetical protein